MGQSGSKTFPSTSAPSRQRTGIWDPRAEALARNPSESTVEARQLVWERYQSLATVRHVLGDDWTEEEEVWFRIAQRAHELAFASRHNSAAARNKTTEASPSGTQPAQPTQSAQAAPPFQSNGTIIAESEPGSNEASAGSPPQSFHARLFRDYLRRQDEDNRQASDNTNSRRPVDYQESYGPEYLAQQTQANAQSVDQQTIDNRARFRQYLERTPRNGGFSPRRAAAAQALADTQQASTRNWVSQHQASQPLNQLQEFLQEEREREQQQMMMQLQREEHEIQYQMQLAAQYQEAQLQYQMQQFQEQFYGYNYGYSQYDYNYDFQAGYIISEQYPEQYPEQFQGDNYGYGLVPMANGNNFTPASSPYSSPALDSPALPLSPIPQPFSPPIAPAPGLWVPQGTPSSTWAEVIPERFPSPIPWELGGAYGTARDLEDSPEDWRWAPRFWADALAEIDARERESYLFG